MSIFKKSCCINLLIKLQNCLTQLISWEKTPVICDTDKQCVITNKYFALMNYVFALSKK